MASYNASSSRALADISLKGISSTQKNVSILIGGLELGVTLRRALDHSEIHSACVVELEPRIIDWNRKHLDNADILDDPRTEIVVGDIYDYIQGTPRSYNGIALDIDKGPNLSVRPENRRMYTVSILNVLQTRLRSSGVLAIGANELNASYERALREVFGEVNHHQAEEFDVNGNTLDSVVYEVQV